MSVFTRRAVAFVVAIVLAGVAAVAAYSYLQGLESEVAEEAEAVVGYAATQRIEPGTLADTAIELGAIEEREIPASLLADGAVTSLDQIRGRVVQEVILPGDQITTARFAAPGQQAEFLAIPPGEQAMSFEVGIIPGVSGYVTRGDRISIIAFLTVPDPDAEEAAPAAPEEEPTDGEEAQTQKRAQFTLQDVEVLSIGRRTPPSEEDPSGGTTVPTESVLLTVAVTAEEAERLAFATLSGPLYLTLLPGDESEPVVTPGRTVDNIFDFEN